jgi:uncharacterized protein (TIRG00374 family)
MPEIYKHWIKWLLSLVLLGVLVYFFWPLLDEIRGIGGLLRTANWVWLVGAFTLQVVSYLFLTWLNVLALEPFAGKIGFWRLAAVLTSMAFIEVAIPSAGASGVAMRVRLLGKFGYKMEEALFSLVVETIAEVIALISVAFFGVVYLLQNNQLTGQEIAWSTAVGSGLVALTWFGWRSFRDPRKSEMFLIKGLAIWNRLAERLNVFRARLGFYQQIPLWKFVLASYGKVLLDIACMGACFYLFNYNINPGTLVTGYGLVLTFSGLAILPGGIGMTDAYVPVIFSWLGVSGGIALAAGLCYRLIAYWLLRFIGFISWLILERRAG